MKTPHMKAGARGRYTRGRIISISISIAMQLFISVSTSFHPIPSHPIHLLRGNLTSSKTSSRAINPNPLATLDPESCAVRAGSQKIYRISQEIWRIRTHGDPQATILPLFIPSPLPSPPFLSPLSPLSPPSPPFLRTAIQQTHIHFHLPIYPTPPTPPIPQHNPNKYTPTFPPAFPILKKRNSEIQKTPHTSKYLTLTHPHTLHTLMHIVSQSP